MSILNFVRNAKIGIFRDARKTIIFLVLLIVALSLTQCNIIWYGINQGVGQIKIVRGAVPIEETLQDPAFPDSLKNRLRLIQEIREFAIDSLGLKDSDSYKSIYDQKGQPILWVVSASPPFKMEEYKWKYPFLGALGYKGFFNENKAVKEGEKLKDEGFDVDVSEVNAWSTLGFFNDPILSNMLLKSEGELARLIIHELTHSTVYIKSDADFNENLATFIGDNGAIYFMKYKYGIESVEYISYINRLHDIDLFSKHMLRGAKQLDSLYSLIIDKPINEKRKIKEGFIQTIISLTDTLSLKDKNTISYVHSSNFRPNNTYFMTYIMYREQQQELKDEFENEFKGEFKNYINHIIETYR